MKGGVLAAASAVSLLLVCSSAGAAALSSFYGHWRIARIAGYGEVSSGESEAEQGLDKAVVITADSIMLPDDPCDRHALTRDVVQVDAFLKTRWQTSRQALDLGAFRLGKTSIHIDAACADALVLDYDDLLMSSGSGAFYIVERAK